MAAEAEFMSKLIWALENGINPLPQAREQSEKLLEETALDPNFCMMLFRVVTDSSLDVHTRQMAATQLKNAIDSDWEPATYRGATKVPLPSLVPEEHKAFIRENILMALFNSPPEVMRVMAEVFRMLSSYDFPAKWPGILERIVGLLLVDDRSMVHAGLFALYLLLKKFRFSAVSASERTLVDEVVSMTVQPLLHIFKSLVALGPEVAPMQVLIGKIFACWVQMGLPPAIREPTIFHEWMEAFLAIFLQPVIEPPEVQACEDEGKRRKYPPWAAKKRSIQVFAHFIARYGQTQEKTYADISQAFKEKYAPVITSACLQVLFGLTTGYLPSRVQQLSLHYLTSGIRFGSAFKPMIPSLFEFSSKILFPMLCFNAQDLAQWQDDPIEYIRKEFDVSEEYFSPRKNAESLLYDLYRIRGRKHLMPMMQFISEILANYLQAPPELKPYNLKDGALLFIACVASRLKDSELFKPQIANILGLHVIPELSSPHAYLRARACVTFSQFWDWDWDETLFDVGMNAMLQCLRDPELPVRVQAAVAMRFLIQSDLGPIKLLPFLQPLLSEFFNIMSEIDSDDLIAALERIVAEFRENVGPYAVELCARLAESFIRVTESCGEDEDEEANVALAALEILRTIITSVQAVGNSAVSIFPQLEAVLVPMLSQCASEKYLEFFEDIARIASLLTYHTPEFTPQLRSLVLLLGQAFMEDWGVDFIANILAPFDNWISRDTDGFLLNEGMNMVHNIYCKAVVDINMPDIYLGSACQLVEVVLHNCRGRIDEYVPGFVGHLATRLTTQKMKLKSSRILSFGLFANALFYNPALTLASLERSGLLQPVFEQWFKCLPKLTRLHDRKMNILGLSSIFSIPFVELPETVRNGIGAIFFAIIKLAVDNAKQRQAEEDDAKSIQSSSFAPEEMRAAIMRGDYVPEPGDNDEVDGEENDDDDDDDDDDEPGSDDPDADDRDVGSEGYPSDEDIPFVDQYHFLQEALFGDDDDDDREGSDLEDEDTYTTPLDNIDETVYFFEQLNLFSTRDAAVWQQFSASIDEAHTTAIQWLLSYRDARLQLLARRQQEKEAAAAAAAAAAATATTTTQ